MEDKEKIQEVLEKEAVKQNGGVCESYYYCKCCKSIPQSPKTPKAFLKEFKEMYKDTNTPCADAFLTLKDITQQIKNIKNDKEDIYVRQEKLKIWKQELIRLTELGDEYRLNEWLGEISSTDTYGMPKAKGFKTEPELDIILKKENIIKKIEDILKKEEERIKSKQYRVCKLEYALNKLKEEENFIIECSCVENMHVQDIITSYKKKYNKMWDERNLRNKIVAIKKKIINIL